MAQKKKEQATVLMQQEIAPGIYDCRIRTGLARESAPGQFIAVYPRDKSTLLPRPISICEVNKEEETLRIVYRVAGKGTAEFSGYRAGDTIDILGVLGNGFPLDKVNKDQTAFLMGGGIGVPPILELAKQLDCNKKIIVGYRDSSCFLREDFEKNGDLYIATEDGSVGTAGNVIDAIRENALKSDIIYACGPMPMLRAIKAYALEADIPAYISLEERMACGVGACLGCVCTTKNVDAHSHVNNARICTDGPVFEAREVEI